MKIPRFLKFLIAGLVIITLTRAAFDKPPLKVYDVLVEIQAIEIDVTPVVTFFEELSNGEITADLKNAWNKDLQGVEGFFINIGNAITSFFNFIANYLVKLFNAVFTMSKNMAIMIWKILKLTLKLFGVVS